MIERKMARNAKIGVFSVSHAVYNEQFPGLYDRFDVYHRELIRLIKENEVEVVDFGIIDSSEQAFTSAEKMRTASGQAEQCIILSTALAKRRE